jgi:uncharacterized protein (DUF433 family)
LVEVFAEIDVLSSNPRSRRYMYAERKVGPSMTRERPTPYKHYHWIIADPEWLGGKPAIRKTRLSVAHVLECLAANMSLDEINESFGGGVSAEAIHEALQAAAELSDRPCVAA